MASEIKSIGFILANCCECCDVIVDFCFFNMKRDYHADINKRRIYIFSHEAAVKVLNFIKGTDLDVIFVNIVKQN